MPSLLALAKRAGTQRAQQRQMAAAIAAQAKTVIQGGPLLRPGVAGRPLVNRDWLAETAVDRYFKASALVYRGVVASATAVGSVRWQAEVLDGDGWRNDDSHPLQALLDQPHAFFNRQAWNELLVMYLALSGNALFEKTVASGRPLPGATKPRVLEMIPLVPQGIDPVPDPELWVKEYVFRGPPRKVWQPDEILHLMLPDPGNPYWGMSPLQAARKVIAMDLAGVTWNLESMANRAIADGVFTTASPLTTAQYEELKDQIWEQHQGVENAHEPWVVGAGKWEEMSRTPIEMDFNETRMRTREEILSSLGIPPVMAGYFENATLANAEVSRRLFWEDMAIPMYVERIAGGLNASIVPHFGQPGKLRVAYDISGIPALRDDLLKKGEGLRVFTSSGVPYNEAIAELELDLKPIPDLGDVPYGIEALKPAPASPFGSQPDMPAQPQGSDGSAAGDLQDERQANSRRPPLVKARKTGFDIRTGIFATDVADSEAPALRRAFLAVIAKLREGASPAELEAAVRASDVGAALSKLGVHRLDDLLRQTLGQGIARTAQRGADLAAEKLAQDIGADLALDAHRLNSWLIPYLKERIAQLVGTTEEAARAFFFDLASGKLGDDVAAAARLLEGTWGLHKQQAAGIRNLYGALLEQGKEPDRALAAALKLAAARLRERAETIATQESLIAANRGNGALWEQAIADGHVASVMATWYTAEDGDVDEECAGLADQEVDIGAGERFHGPSGATYREPPGPHPGCRCGLLYSGIT